MVGHQVAERSATYEVTQQLTLASDLQWTTMGEISDVVGGGTPKTNDPANFEGGDVPWITPADLSGYTAKYISRGNRFITRKGFESSAARLLPAGAVLFSSRAPIGYVAIASGPIATNQGFKSFILKDGVLPDYVYWWLKGSKHRAEALASGTTFLELSGANAKKIPIPVVPLERQRAVVAEIEKQFSRLDEAVAGLKRVKANLKRYKAAVLKAAVEGCLVPTEADLAHREGRDYETGPQLLQRILETRRSKWQGKGKYKEPVAPDTADLPELPVGWVWASVDQAAENFDGTRVPVRAQDRAQRQGRYPYYGASGVIDHVDGYLFDGEYILVAEDGANLLSRATPIAFIAIGQFWVNNHAHVVRTNEGMPMAFLEIVLNAKDLAPFVTGSAQPKLTQASLNKIPVPLPPPAEQHGIVAEVDRLLSIARESEAEIEANLKRAQSLRQTILSKAFASP